MLPKNLKQILAETYRFFSELDEKESKKSFRSLKKFYKQAFPENVPDYIQAFLNGKEKFAKEVFAEAANLLEESIQEENNDSDNNNL